jgi:SAM-dependent methyltransferase
MHEKKALDSGSMVIDSPSGRLVDAMDVGSGVPYPDLENESSPKAYYQFLFSDDAAIRTEALRREIAFLRYLFLGAGITAFDQLDVLEVGSGFGVHVVALACLDVRRALGLELGPRAVEWGTRWSRSLPPALGDRIEMTTGTASALPYESESVDAVLSVEAISHYLDHELFLAEAARVLRPGGSLIISDGNNGLNPFTRYRRRALWAAHEEPPGPARTNPPDSPFHFVDRRRAVVAEAFPQLTDDETLAIALGTAGMVRPEILEAAGRYVEDGTLPTQTYKRGQLTVHPTEEMVMEHLFNPFRLARQIEAYGLRAKVRGHWAGATRRRSLRLANRVLATATPVTIFGARAFCITARKPADGR